LMPELLRRPAAALAQLFAAPGCESAGRAVIEPALTHLLAPLVWLGLLEALRRRRDPAVRALAIWVVGSVLIPAALGRELPRRLLLMLPFVYALAALPVIEASRDPSRTARRWTAAGLALLVLACAIAGAHGYFGRWYVEPDASSAPSQMATPQELRGSFLELSRELKKLPRHSTVALAPLFPGARMLLRTFDTERPQRGGGRLAVRRSAVSAQAVHDATCELALPFVWVAPDDPESRERFAALGREFRVEQHSRGPFLFVSVLKRRPHACPPIAGGAMDRTRLEPPSYAEPGESP
jgi:hypothetical protein